ncbi:MAG TPA: glycoside hydrolase family 18 protein [Phototrophicaceae bacterium]|nr:glycoside hydrolase family 18 protein [Phototrophicaceae bacterium]
MRLHLLMIVFAALLIAAPLNAQPSPNSIINAYFANWSIYDRQYFVTDIPADKLTDLTYAFASISDNGEIALSDPWADTQFPYPNDADNAPLKGNFHQLQLLKAAHPNVRTLISIGGWTGSAKFSDVALTAASRDKFARSVAHFVQQYGFDGVDIDWEYPTGDGDAGNVERPQDKDNFILLLAALRQQLDTLGAGHLLTIALGSTPSNYQPLDWAKIAPLLDWINVMTYDMSGEWSEVTGFNAPLYNSTANPPEGGSDDATISGLLALGVPASKLVLGVPFYGRGWTGVGIQNNGLHQPYTGLPAGTSEQGSYDYWDLAAHYVGKYARFWDETAQVPWLYDATSGTMISYEDPVSLAHKANYVREHSLGGAMIWEISEDSPDSALLTALYNGLHSTS